jgi:hypothetical protein
MSKLEIEFELTGLKLKIKGDSDDVSGKVGDLQRQVQGLMNTIGSITQGASAPALPPAPASHNGTTSPAQKVIEAAAEPSSNGRKGRTPGPRKGTPKAPRAEPIDFKHDAEKYGFPKQEWNTAQKGMWLLYVLSSQTGQHEYSAPVLAATFNKHFKSFGSVLAHNLARDLNAQKGKTGWVNSDATQEPPAWLLLEEGKKAMAKLIEESKAPKA